MCAAPANAMSLMRIWVIKDGELLPSQSDERLMRTGMLAKELVVRGHDVTWWATTFSHQHKMLVRDRGGDIVIGPRYRLRLLHAGAYRRNVSATRYLHHWRAGVEFRRQALLPAPPDVIVTAFPTIDLAFEAIRYAKHHDVPVIIDVRDAWPDVFVEKTPWMLRPAARFVFAADRWRAKYALRGAQSIVATSKAYLRWGAKNAGRSVGNDDRVFYIGYPTPERITASTRRDAIRRRCSESTIFTFIGSFGPSYELDLICDAAEVVRDREEIHFVIAGAGQQGAMLERRVRTLANVTLLPWQNAAEARALLQASHVGLVPCRFARDRMPNKVFEYFGAGLPILSSLEGETETLLSDSHAGLSYRCGDVTAFVRHVERLSSDVTLRERLALNSARLCDSQFAAEGIYQAYAEHVEQVARDGAAASRCDSHRCRSAS